MTKFQVGDVISRSEFNKAYWEQSVAIVEEITGEGYNVRSRDHPTHPLIFLSFDKEPNYDIYSTIDPCAGITCPNTCDGTSLYSQKCVNGHCVKDALIESNSPTCGYTPPAPTPTPAKGEVYNLNYPANAKNGETITIKASVLNKGGTSGEFSLRLIAAPQMVLVTRYVGWIAPYRFSVLESLSVTMPSSGASANLGVQCISMDGVIDDTETFTIALTPPIPTPKFSVGDQLCSDQEEIKHWFTRPRDITGLDSTGYITEGLRVPFDWDPYMHICVEEEPPVDACTGITCPNICSDGSLFSQKCVDGICVKDILLKSPANAPECYVSPDEEPDTGEPDDEPDDEVPDLMPGQTCVGSDLHQLISGGLIGDLIEANSPKCIGVEPVPPEGDSIFGDLDTKWIVIAVIGIIILGLLS